MASLGGGHTPKCRFNPASRLRPGRRRLHVVKALRAGRFARQARGARPPSWGEPGMFAFAAPQSTITPANIRWRVFQIRAPSASHARPANQGLHSRRPAARHQSKSPHPYSTFSSSSKHTCFNSDRVIFKKRGIPTSSIRNGLRITGGSRAALPGPGASESAIAEAAPARRQTFPPTWSWPGPRSIPGFGIRCRGASRAVIYCRLQTNKVCSRSHLIQSGGGKRP